MNRRQTVPRQWLVADNRTGSDLVPALRRLPRGSGVLVLYRKLPPGERGRLLIRLRRIARSRGLLLVDEAANDSARIHDIGELRRASLRRVPLVFLSPLYPTRSHPGRRPLGRMPAAALARLSLAPVIALGGMSAKRFSRIEPLGFQGWAGIDAWTFASRC